MVLSALGLRSCSSWAYSCSAIHGICPDQGSNPHLLHWQADSLPLRPPSPSPGSPVFLLYSHAHNTSDNTYADFCPTPHCSLTSSGHPTTDLSSDTVSQEAALDPQRKVSVPRDCFAPNCRYQPQVHMATHASDQLAANQRLAPPTPQV